MPSAQTHVIVGASLAGAKAAETLRGEGFDGAIVLLGAETDRPYERPPLSKEVLLGSKTPDVAFVHDASWYAEHDVDLRLGTRVTSVDRGARQVRLEDGSGVGYTRLLLTTGASARRLAVPGADLEGLMYLRTMPESAALAARLQQGGHVVIAGAGWIGLEAAAAARQAGCEVTVVEPEPAPLCRSIGPELGEVFGRLHRSHGVTFRLGESIAELRGDPAGGSVAPGQAHGTVRQVVTSAGTVLDADFVIAGIGAVPNVSLAAEAGLDVDDGILVDASLRTSDPDIFAAGDAVKAFNPLLGRRITVQHWSNALNGGPAAARAMLGQEVSYDRVPYFFTDQYDLGMETAGLPEPGTYDRVVYRGDPESGEFIAFWLSGGSVVAGMNINVWDVNEDIQSLIRAGGAVDVARLTDASVPLAEV
ncbi:MAG TPA: FAD-dependent oxidoreductase [Streptosporangiaceae bacterium]|nr:FAD-dependent oxidoreductase [Streptosporangiaceae bacterium]